MNILENTQKKICKKHPLKGSFIVKLKAMKDLTFSMCNFRIV